jgi:hypothetical protein
MKYEQALVGKRPAGSRLLRSFLVKFTAHDPNVESNIWGPFYAGGPVPEVRQEANLRQHILDVSMSKARARRILQSAEQLLIWQGCIQMICRKRLTVRSSLWQSSYTNLQLQTKSNG